MGWTEIDLDDELMARVMRIFGLSTKQDAVHFALRRLIEEKMSVDGQLEMEGIGWEGNLSAMRTDRFNE